MREHPIPQDITSYRFHIIGSMTLKQFGEVFLGVIIALIFYKTNLFFPIKWFFVLASVGLGAAAAFVPIEERPLDHWIITFFRILYKPTQFFWRKEPTIPPAFLYEPQSDVTSQAPQVDLMPIRRDRIKEYLRSVSAPTTSDQSGIPDQTERIQSILETFKTQPTFEPTQVKHVEQKPDLSVRVRKMRTDVILPEATSVVLPPNEVTVFAGSQNNASQQSQFVGVTVLPDVDARDFSKIDKVILPVEQAAQGVDIPQEQLIKIEPTVTQETATSAAGGPNSSLSETLTNQAYVSNQTSIEPTISIPEVPVSFNANLPFPSAPDAPNKLVGMVLSTQAELITDAIVEIHAPDGTIARAVKTNALGQFFISTPLGDGQYTLVAEKDGYTFEPQQLTLTGAIVPPIEVRSV